ncbi:MAG: hypothetical protein N2510_00700, partial [Ignavibacteria bacterium]|nr:hypothetical protein [Ignavibacteria bacterium]
MFKTQEGSTRQLIEFCIGYFTLYVITGISVKYFTGTGAGFPNMSDMKYLVYNTMGGNLLALFIVIILKWYKLESNNYSKLFNIKIPSELYYIVPSGIC